MQLKIFSRPYGLTSIAAPTTQKLKFLISTRGDPIFKIVLDSRNHFRVVVYLHEGYKNANLAKLM